MHKKKKLYKSNGIPTPSAADAIEQEDIMKIREYFSSLDLTKPNNLRNFTLFFVGLNFGIRGTDLISLTQDKVFLNGKVVDWFYIIEQKTFKRKRVVINQSAKTLLQKYYDTFYDKVLKTSPYVFPSRKRNQGKGRLEIQSLDYIFTTIKKGAKLSKHINFSSHTLRKSLCQALLENGRSIEEIQLLLGHNSPMTTKLYLKLGDTMANELYNAVSF